MNVVFSSSSLAILIWWYPEKASRKQRRSHPAVESTIWSILGSGYGSLGQALLRSVKSTQHRFPPVYLGTTKGLASQSAWMISRMILASNSFSTSLMMNSCFSSAWRLAFYFTGRAPGHTANWCSITSLGTPGMSDAVLANMSAFARRKAMSALSYLGGNPAPMVRVAPVPSALREIFLVATLS